MRQSSKARPSETREKILDTAIELICNSTYESVGIAEICSHVGVTKGGFYHYFDSKSSLYREAAHHYWDKLKIELDAVFSLEHNSLQKLEGLIDFIVKKQYELSTKENPVSGCPFFISGAQCGSDESCVQEVAEELSEKAVTYNTGLVKSLQTDGVLAKPCDVVQVARLIHQFIKGLLLYCRVHNSLDTIETDLREGLYRIIDLKHEYRKKI